MLLSSDTQSFLLQPLPAYINHDESAADHSVLEIQEDVDTPSFLLQPPPAYINHDESAADHSVLEIQEDVDTGFRVLYHKE